MFSKRRTLFVQLLSLTLVCFFALLFASAQSVPVAHPQPSQKGWPPVWPLPEGLPQALSSKVAPPQPGPQQLGQPPLLPHPPGVPRNRLFQGIGKGRRRSPRARRAAKFRDLAPFTNPIFGQVFNLPVDGYYSRGVATGDFNGDGYPDLAVASACNYIEYDQAECPMTGGTDYGQVTILLGKGDGTFQPPVVYPITGQFNTEYVATGDFNGDGILDLVTSNSCYDSSCDGSVTILFGNGDGTFRAPENMGTGAQNGGEVVVRDFNNDGKLDFAVVSYTGNCSDSVFTVFINQGGGNFQVVNSANNGICGEVYYSMDAADFNGDGIMDLAMSGQNPEGSLGVRIWLGNGDGTFNGGGFYASGGGANPNNVTARDVNGDGIADLVVGNSCASDTCAHGSVSVLLNLGNGGGFATAVEYPTGPNTLDPVVGDLNNDGLLDIIAGNSDGTASVLLNQGGGTFSAALPYSIGLDYPDIGVVADFNQDGNIDIAFVDQCGDPSCVGRAGTVSVALGAGDGTFPEFQANSGGEYAVSVAMADVSGDGKPDLLVANECASGANCPSSGGSVGVLLGRGDGTFQAAVPYGSGGEDALSVAVADVNGDGKPDLLVTNACASADCSNGGSVSVMLGNGDGTFQAAVPYGSGGEDALSVAVADVNGDGKPDLLVANNCASNCLGGSISVLLGNGDGTFQAAVPYGSGGEYASSIAVADVNGDGKPDLLVANECASNPCANGSVSVLLGNGDGTFRTAVPYGSGGDAALSVAVADVNGDGKPDLLVANNCASNCLGGSISVLLGNGDGSFQTAVPYGSGGEVAYSVAVGDVNGDGKPDLLVANEYLGSDGNYGRDSVGVLLGNGDGTFQPAVSYGPGGGMRASVALGDVNGDGKLDATVVSDCVAYPYVCFDGGVTVLRNLFSAPAATNLKFTSSANSIAAFKPVTLNANVSSTLTGMLSGSVIFTSDGVSLGGAIVGGTGQATLTTSALNAGKHFVFAAYSGDNNYAPSNSFGFYITVSVGQTATTVTSGPTPSVYGQPVSLTANVSSTYGSPTGTVTFLDSGSPIGSAPLSGGTAKLSTTQFGVGTHSITASYSGDANFATSASSNTAGQVVTPATSSIVLSSSAAATVYGQAVTFMAAITPQYGGIATGTVTFKDGGTAIGSGTVSGNAASFTTTALGVGTHTITAVYSGDTNVNGSSSGVLPQSVTQATTTTSVTSSVNPALINEPITFTATVVGKYGGPATGSILFKSGTTKLGTITLSANQANVTTSFPTAGTHSITAQYVGDINNIGSTYSALSQSVVLKFATTTVVTSSLNPSDINQSVTFTATASSASGSIPNGEVVTFTNGAATLGTGTTTGGIATYMTTALAVGSHSIKAAYAGDATFAASTSAALTQMVDLYPTTTMLAATPNPSAYGQSVALVANVSSSAPSGPTGTVTFKYGSTTLGMATLIGGTASLATTKLALGSGSLTTTYNGDAQNGKSTSAVLLQTVDQATISMALASSPNPSNSGQSVKFTATLSSNGSLPTGTVTFSYNGSTLGTATIAAGKATFSTKALPAGMDQVTATYAGSADYSSATASASQTVN